MKDILRPTIILLIICAIAGGTLALIYQQTAPVIAKNKKAEEELARREVLTLASEFQPVKSDSDTLLYKGLDEEGKLVGYVFTCEEEGYGGIIQTMVGIDTLFQISGIKVISQQETPGLGANCTTPEFTEQFIGKNPEVLMVKKDGGEIEAISGATITSRAITDAIREKFSIIKKTITKDEERGKQ